jgi:hypothetical protein
MSERLSTEGELLTVNDEALALEKVALKVDRPKKGEIWSRWDTLITVLDVTVVGRHQFMVQYMTPDYHIGSMDSLTWRAWASGGAIFVVAR